MRPLLVLLINLFLILLITASPLGAATVDELYQKALQLDKEEFFDEAAQTWEQLLKSNPEKPLQTFATLKLSSTYLKLTEPLKAVETLKKLTRSQPDHFDAQFHLGNALAKIKNYPEAIDAFKKTIELRPNEGLGNVGLALAYFGNRQPDAAIQQLQKAKKIFKKKKNISWYRDSRIMVAQIKGFAKYPPSFSDLWLANNLELVRNTYEKAVFNLESLNK
jgi:tetratricopeptide (TPR) repeat protein